MLEKGILKALENAFTQNPVLNQPGLVPVTFALPETPCPYIVVRISPEESTIPGISYAQMCLEIVSQKRGGIELEHLNKALQTCLSKHLTSPEATFVFRYIDHSTKVAPDGVTKKCSLNFHVKAKTLNVSEDL